MRNKNGFTLTELLLVLVILGVVSMITIPGVMKAYEKSQSEKGEGIENLILENLKMYNEDFKDELWGDSLTGEKDLNINVLKQRNPELDIKDCEVNELKIKKDADRFSYIVKITCGDYYKTN